MSSESRLKHLQIELLSPNGAFPVSPGAAVAYEQGGRWYRGTFERVDDKGDVVVAIRCSANSTPSMLVRLTPKEDSNGHRL